MANPPCSALQGLAVRLRWGFFDASPGASIRDRRVAADWAASNCLECSMRGTLGAPPPRISTNAELLSSPLAPPDFRKRAGRSGPPLLSTERSTAPERRCDPLRTRRKFGIATRLVVIRRVSFASEGQKVRRSNRVEPAFPRGAVQTFNMGRVPPVTFGAGRVAKLPDLVAGLGGGPVLIVADAALKRFGVTDRLAEALTARGIAHDVAAEVAGEPKETLVDDLCMRARDAGSRCVIGLGGGAAMDTAKLVAALARSPQPARAFALASQPLPGNGLPSIAIPTTAGTGSEVTRTSIVSTPEGLKNWYWGEDLMFAQAVLDPELTVSLPAHLTAWTGIDAVAHAIEGATARATNPAGLLYGLEALRLLAEFLPRAVAEGTDIEVRGRVLWASMLAGLALHNCNTHMGHNISHALGSLARVHHGLVTGLALEVSLPWLVARPEGAENYARVSQALGGAATAEALPDAFADLMRACRIPAQLPVECTGVSDAALAAEMKNAANLGMSQNAACTVTEADLDAAATLMMRLPVAAASA
ncbi:MAG: iron-containing alcohol dehydrogenase [Pseudomonadota bacterium]